METSIQKNYVVGIDIGGTNTVIGIVDQQGNIMETSSVKTGEYARVEDYVEAVCDVLLLLIKAYGGTEKFRGIGIGAPNGNYYRGTIEEAPNLPWKGVIHLAQMFKERTGIPAALTNDANAAALGEMAYGATRGMKDFIMITLGTGVGSGIVVNGQMLYGHDGFAGELGHVCVDRSPEARVCGCGRKGCLEAYSGGEYLKQIAKRELPHRPELQDAMLLDRAAAGGDADAVRIMSTAAEYNAVGVAGMIQLYSPDAMIFSGGQCRADGFLYETTLAKLREILPEERRNFEISITSLGEFQSALGAARLAYEQFF